MPWFKVDDGFHGHPKVIDLTPADVGIWTLAGTWCASYLTDGLISLQAVARLGGTEANCQALVGAGMWLDAGDGAYQFKDWEDYQPMKADVEAERDAARERMRKVRTQRKGTRPERSEDVRPNSEGTSEEVRPTPTRPDPTRPALSKESAKAGSRKKPAHTLPESWKPNDAHSQYAKEEGIALDFQAERFRTHAEANDRRIVNWDAAFKNWLLKAERTVRAKPTAASPWSKEFHQ